MPEPLKVPPVPGVNSDHHWTTVPHGLDVTVRFRSLLAELRGESMTDRTVLVMCLYHVARALEEEHRIDVVKVLRRRPPTLRGD